MGDSTCTYVKHGFVFCKGIQAIRFAVTEAIALWVSGGGGSGAWVRGGGFVWVRGCGWGQGRQL